MLRHSRRFGGPIGQLALAVNGGDAARADTGAARPGSESVRWIEHAQPAQLLQLAHGRLCAVPGSCCAPAPVRAA